MPAKYKLHPLEVLAICEYVGSGKSYKHVAMLFGVSKGLVSDIYNGRKYCDVTGRKLVGDRITIAGKPYSVPVGVRPWPIKD